MQAIYVHKDGKLFPDVIYKEKDDRISVMISSVNNEQLLEVPTLKSRSPHIWPKCLPSFLRFFISAIDNF